tara:strand:- start:7804 stop:8916 length:1113 start_codon:yes stop_codon:yes gene_type:complete
MLHYVHKLGTRSLARIIGLFVFSAMGVLIIVILNIDNQQNFFNKRYKIHIALNRGFGLIEGSPVDIAGLEVGNIESIRFNAQNKIDVTAEIQKKYKEKIRTDSVATVVSQGLMGNAGLSITLGSLSVPILEDGGYISGTGISKTDGIIGGINPILMKANKAIDNIINLTDILDKPLVRIEHILQNLDEVSEEIKMGKGNIGALLKDKGLYSNLTNVVRSSQKLLISMEKAVNNIELASQQFPKIINNAELSMTKINKSTEKVQYLLSDGQEVISNVKNSSNDFNKLIRDSNEQIMRISEILEDFKNTSSELPDLIRVSQENIDEITRIVVGAEKNWIIKGFLERKKKEEPIIVDMRDGHYKETTDEEETY